MEHLNIWDFNLEMVLGIFLSVVLGFILGLEREITNKWAGLRTHILVCLGSCLFTTLSIYGFLVYSDPADIMSTRYGDPSRVAAQVLTGIGFIGGGTVLRHGASIYGLTTAATLWVSASIGMACACGMYKLAIFTALLSVAVLVLIRLFEKKFIRRSFKNKCKIEICLSTSDLYVDEVYSDILNKFNNILELKKELSTTDENATEIIVLMETNGKVSTKTFYSQLSEIKNINAVTVRELHE